MPRENETYWICLNRDCGNSAACKETECEQESRLCDCGSLMKRGTHPMVYSYLNFLRETPDSETEEKKEEEETPCERGMWALQPSGERLRWS
jgi:hypothetical protein